MEYEKFLSEYGIEMVFVKRFHIFAVGPMEFLWLENGATE